MTPLAIKVSKFSAISRLIFSTAFSSLFMACHLHPRYHEDEWICLIFSMLFGGYALYSLWLLYDPSPRLLIDDKGINSISLGMGVIPWAVILDARSWETLEVSFIYLSIRETEPWAEEMSSLGKFIANSAQKCDYPSVRINVTNLATPSYEILRIIRQQIREHHADKIPA